MLGVLQDHLAVPLPHVRVQVPEHLHGQHQQPRAGLCNQEGGEGIVFAAAPKGLFSFPGPWRKPDLEVTCSAWGCAPKQDQDCVCCVYTYEKGAHRDEVGVLLSCTGRRQWLLLLLQLLLLV